MTSQVHTRVDLWPLHTRECPSREAEIEALAGKPLPALWLCHPAWGPGLGAQEASQAWLSLSHHPGCPRGSWQDPADGSATHPKHRTGMADTGHSLNTRCSSTLFRQPPRPPEEPGVTSHFTKEETKDWAVCDEAAQEDGGLHTGGVTGRTTCDRSPERRGAGPQARCAPSHAAPAAAPTPGLWRPNFPGERECVCPVHTDKTTPRPHGAPAFSAPPIAHGPGATVRRQPVGFVQVSVTCHPLERRQALAVTSHQEPVRAACPGTGGGGEHRRQARGAATLKTQP